MIITGTGSSEGTWTLKRTSIDHYRDRILDKDMDSEKDESCMIITGTGSLTGTFDREKMSHDHYRDRILDRDMDSEKDES
jgi:hypothetical protein